MHCDFDVIPQGSVVVVYVCENGMSQQGLLVFKLLKFFLDL